MSGGNILKHVRQSAVLIYGFPCHGSVISRAVSNLKCNCQRQAYANGGLHKVTQGSEWTATLSLTHSRIHVLTPHCFRRHDHTRFFYDFISCLRAISISPSEHGRATLHGSQLRSDTQVSTTNRLDNTTRLSHGKVYKTTVSHTRCTHRHC
jgi:hypothetical protein